MKSRSIVINRIFQNDIKTISVAGVFQEPYYLYEFVTIELPWRDNTRGISCIPEGTYRGEAVQKNQKYAIQIKDVPDRDSVYITNAIFLRQLEGCIAPGTSIKELDRSGTINTISSRMALACLEMEYPLGSEMEIQIKDVFKIHGNVNPATIDRKTLQHEYN